MQAESTLLETPLKSLSEFMRQCGFLATYLPRSQDNPIEQLLVDSAPPALSGGEIDYILQIFFLNDALTASEAPTLQARGEISAMLQFFMPLSLPVPESKLYELAYLTSALSKLLPIGALQVTREDGLFYRYCLMHPSKNINQLLIVEVIEMVGLLIRELTPLLAAFVREERTLSEALQAVEHRFAEMAQGK